MNKGEITRTINNINYLRNAIITKHLIPFDKDKVGTQTQLMQEELNNLIFYLKQIKKEVL